MHTFDKKLLDMDGLVDKADGTKLKICKPDVGEPLPLLQAATEHFEELIDDESSEEDANSKSEENGGGAPAETGSTPGEDGAIGANEIRRSAKEAPESPAETKDGEKSGAPITETSLAPPEDDSGA